MREWRNRQTRTFEGRVVIPYGFKSRLSHQAKGTRKRAFCCYIRLRRVILRCSYLVHHGSLWDYNEPNVFLRRSSTNRRGRRPDAPHRVSPSGKRSPCAMAHVSRQTTDIIVVCLQTRGVEDAAPYGRTGDDGFRGVEDAAPYGFVAFCHFFFACQFAGLSSI